MEGRERVKGFSKAQKLFAETGTAVVEMAVVLPLLILLVYGILDFGRAMDYKNNATHLANIAARFAVVNANPGTPQTLQAWIQSQGDTSEMRNSTVCIDFFGKANPQVGDPVRVTVKATGFNWIEFFGFTGVSVSGNAVMRLEQPLTTPSYSEGSGGTGTCP
jgi:Flp pilus assembly protein TadG